MPAKMLKSFLDKHRVKYVGISHSPTYTAQEIAASASTLTMTVLAISLPFTCIGALCDPACLRFFSRA
jgi:hypothetical protein